MMRKMGDEVTDLNLSSTAADIVCFINTWSVAGGIDCRCRNSQVKALWDFFCGLRGPDMVGNGVIRLKDITTARLRFPLRAMARGLCTVAKLYNTPSIQCPQTKVLPLPKGTPADMAAYKDLEADHYHFKHHVVCARKAIEKMFPEDVPSL